MDETGAKPSQEPKDVPTTMQETMERMCCSGQFSPAEMCSRMMQAMGRRSNSEARSAAEAGTTSDEGGRSGDDEAPHGCCGRQSRCASKRP